MSGDYESYVWYETSYGRFRIEKKCFRTWTSYCEKGTELLTATSRKAVIHLSGFHLEGLATNWSNARITNPNLQ
jgi:hypothetical protein